MLSELRRPAVAAATLALVALTPATAHADRWSAPDDSGDVTGLHYDPEPQPCGTSSDVDGSADADDDITKVVVRHAPRAVHVVVHLRDLDPDLEQSVSVHFAVAGTRGWYLDVDRVRTPSGKFKVWDFFGREAREPDPEDLDECGAWLGLSGATCRVGSSVELDTSTVRTTVPRRCLHHPDSVRVGVESRGWSPVADDRSFDVFSDVWGIPEEGASTWLPPFGPEVPVSAGA